MTSSINWLKARAPGYASLSENEYQAISDFCFLWSLFESRILDTFGNAAKICEKVKKWSNEGVLDEADFNDGLRYFRDRYYAGGNFTSHFDNLNLRKPDRQALVRAVINGSDNDPCNCMAAALIVIFRFRNNLFHGVKWQYELAGQIKNFTVANNILIRVLEKHGELAVP